MNTLNEKVQSEVTPRKVGFGLKLSGVLRIEREGLIRD